MWYPSLGASNQGEQSKATDTHLEIKKGGQRGMWEQGQSGDRAEGREERKEGNGGREGHRPWIPHYYHLLHSEHSICSTAGLHTDTHTQWKSCWDMPEIVVVMVKVWFSWPEPRWFIKGIRKGQRDWQRETKKWSKIEKESKQKQNKGLNKLFKKKFYLQNRGKGTDIQISKIFNSGYWREWQDFFKINLHTCAKSADSTWMVVSNKIHLILTLNIN